MSDTFIVAREGAVTTLTFNRPQVRNALNAEMMAGLRQAVEACADDGTRCVVITGAGGAFSSGADLEAIISEGVTPDALYRQLTEVYAPALKAVRACPWPVIAAVDGYAVGIACDLALACDIRLVSQRAVFAELFIRIGLIPDGGGTYLLPRIVGLGRALEMMLTGKEVDAQEALRIGLANAVYPVERFEEAVAHYAETLSQKSPLALRLGKAAMLQALDGDYAQALEVEARWQQQIFQSADGQEGIRAFLEKRQPRWRGE